MTQDEFKALARMEDSRVLLRFTDGQTVTATLLSVSTDLDGSQHLIYQISEESSPAGGTAIYSPGEQVISCVPLDGV